MFFLPLFFTSDGEYSFADGDLYIVRVQARQLGDEVEVILVFIDIDRRIEIALIKGGREIEKIAVEILKKSSHAAGGEVELTARRFPFNECHTLSPFHCDEFNLRWCFAAPISKCVPHDKTLHFPLFSVSTVAKLADEPEIISDRYEIFSGSHVSSEFALNPVLT